MLTTVKPVVLLILDGWGHREEREDNAILAAKTPVWDRLWSQHPHTLIHTSGAEVGLPGGQMGNSEVGHLNLGAGRVVYQELTRVSRSVRTGSFFDNRTLTEAVDTAIAEKSTVHIFGLLSPGGVHSQEEHILAMVRLAVERGCRKVQVHAFLDGRDTPPKSAAPSIAALEDLIGELGAGRIASVSGRFYAMDRDNRWDRVQQVYDLMTLGEAEYQTATAMQALDQAYERGEADEFVKPTLIGKAEPIQDGDVVVFMNFRADRARQLTRTFIEPNFNEFERRARPRLASFVSLTEYNKDFDIPVAFPPERLNNVFGEYIAKLGLRQLRLAETEKYAHVTFFFNGGREEPNEGEDRILVPSPKVATYDLQPQMSAQQVTDHLVEAIRGDQYEAIICNYANADMVGHSGDFDAAILAVEAIDDALGQVLQALQEVGGEMLVTADHGNAEMMADPETGQPHTAHTNNLVPLIYVGRPASFSDNGALCDISPTLLQIMGIKQPPEMIGRPLLELATDAENRA
jgi:2,3-bisphosphoglycerate-independent phosphoglycerate mutase